MEQPKQWETENFVEFVDAIHTLVPCIFKITWLKHAFLIWVLFFKVLATRAVSAGYVMHQQFNIQQLYALPTLYLCVLYLSENKQQLVPLIA